MSNYVIGSDEAIKQIVSGKNCFISGAAGSGKSSLLGTIKAFFGNSSVIIAPTGLAALNVGGVTAHKLLGLSFGVTEKHHYENLKSCKSKRLLKSKSLERIIIDESSMLRLDKFIEISEKLCRIRKNSKPFGGLQVIVVADFLQLPPIVSYQERQAYYQLYHSPFCFDSLLWEQCDFVNVLLDTVHRQRDPIFSQLLCDIREGKNLYKHIEYLNKHCVNNTLSEKATVFCSTNSRAEEINKKFYDKINSQEHTFKAVIRDEFPDRPVDEVMKYKVGAKVIILVNGENYVNGTVGIIKQITRSEILIDIGNGELARVKEKVWKNIKYTVVKDEKKEDVIIEETIGEYYAFPIKLAYAVTIHKSQGMTTDETELDLGTGSFASGQTYVGLSRVRTLAGLKLTRPLTLKDIIIDKRILNFYKKTFGDK